MCERRVFATRGDANTYPSVMETSGIRPAGDYAGNRMNATIPENASFLLSCDRWSYEGVSMIPNLVSLIIRLPLNIYVLQQLISRHLISLEFYTLNEAVFELLICLYDVLGLVKLVICNTSLWPIRALILGFLVTGRPCLLTLICMERYVAVVRPVFFLSLKALKYKLPLCAVVWLCALAYGLGVGFMSSGTFYDSSVVQIFVCCAVKLYFCIATLLALKKPGPGAGVRRREGMSKDKLKAFRIILILTASVMLMYVPLAFIIIFHSYFTPQQFQNLINKCYVCTAMPGFVQASLFLQRAGKLRP